LEETEGGEGQGLKECPTLPKTIVENSILTGMTTCLFIVATDLLIAPGNTKLI
jgi:hypothetical protein